jgi:hypothetical protein
MPRPIANPDQGTIHVLIYQVAVCAETGELFLATFSRTLAQNILLAHEIRGRRRLGSEYSLFVVAWELNLNLIRGSESGQK